MMKNREAPLYCKVSTFLLFVAIGICSFAAMGRSARAGERPAGPLSGQSPATLKETPARHEPDNRYKADILLIVAHPDDEQGVTAYLARAMDEHKRVAILWCTRGDTGSDAVGYVAAAALGAEREIEARRAAASLGITNVWFIGAHDTPSQNVLWSLERWNHGAALEEAVRIVRLTRPEIIISLLPDYYTGENHGDHQAAGVIASEAFDMAGDPTKFPEQIAPARIQSFGIMNTEGLRTWQPEKIYYEANPAQRDFMGGEGPHYSTTDISPSRHVPYYLLAAKSLSNHMTQGGGRVKEALASGRLERFQRPVQLVLGKSLVGGSAPGDVFEGVVPGPIPFAPVRGYQPMTHSGVSIELGGSFAFYRRFWRAHNLDRIAHLMPTPEMGIIPGGELPVPLIIHNYTNDLAEVDLTVQRPSGWTELAGSARYPVRAHDFYPVLARLKAPAQGAGEWQQITWRAQSGGQTIGSATIQVYLESRPGMPQ